MNRLFKKILLLTVTLALFANAPAHAWSWNLSSFSTAIQVPFYWAKEKITNILLPKTNLSKSEWTNETIQTNQNSEFFTFKPVSKELLDSECEKFLWDTKQKESSEKKDILLAINNCYYRLTVDTDISIKELKKIIADEANIKPEEIKINWSTKEKTWKQRSDLQGIDYHPFFKTEYPIFWVTKTNVSQNLTEQPAKQFTGEQKIYQGTLADLWKEYVGNQTTELQEPDSSSDQLIPGAGVFERDFERDLEKIQEEEKHEQNDDKRILDSNLVPNVIQGATEPFNLERVNGTVTPKLVLPTPESNALSENIEQPRDMQSPFAHNLIKNKNPQEKVASDHEQTTSTHENSNDVTQTREIHRDELVELQKELGQENTNTGNNKEKIEQTPTETSTTEALSIAELRKELKKEFDKQILDRQTILAKRKRQATKIRQKNIEKEKQKRIRQREEQIAEQNFIKEQETKKKLEQTIKRAIEHNDLKIVFNNIPMITDKKLRTDILMHAIELDNVAATELLLLSGIQATGIKSTLEYVFDKKNITKWASVINILDPNKIELKKQQQKEQTLIDKTLALVSSPANDQIISPLIQYALDNDLQDIVVWTVDRNKNLDLDSQYTYNHEMMPLETIATKYGFDKLTEYFSSKASIALSDSFMMEESKEPQQEIKKEHPIRSFMSDLTPIDEQLQSTDIKIIEEGTPEASNHVTISAELIKPDHSTSIMTFVRSTRTDDAYIQETDKDNTILSTHKFKVPRDGDYCTDEVVKNNLFSAAISGYTKLATFLLDHFKADPNSIWISESGNKTSLLSKVINEYDQPKVPLENMLELLIAKGARLESSEESIDSPLITSIRSIRLDCVKFFIGKKVNVNAAGKSGSPLWYAQILLRQTIKEDGTNTKKIGDIGTIINTLKKEGAEAKSNNPILRLANTPPGKSLDMYNELDGVELAKPQQSALLKAIGFCQNNDTAQRRRAELEKRKIITLDQDDQQTALMEGNVQRLNQDYGSSRIKWNMPITNNKNK